MNTKLISIVVILAIVFGVGLLYILSQNNLLPKKSSNSASLGDTAKLDDLIAKADPEADKENFQLFVSAAQSSDIVEIDAKCQLKPKIVSTTIKPTITFKNTAPVSHTIVFSKEVIATISAGQSLEFEVKNVTDRGLFHMICDTQPAGVLIVQ